MAQKTLNAFVVIGGKVDNSFNNIGTQFLNLGTTVDEISQKLINFGKESVNVYKNYDYNMTALEKIWGSNGKFQADSAELISAMNEMRIASSQWAASTIFHTNDIANAMVEAAHAGWNMEEMLGGIPVAMRIAQAGGMDLSTGLNYVLKCMETFGLEYDQLENFTDMWIYAANRSAGTAQEFGDTFLRMGSTVQFATDPAEILAMTAAMHNMGATGSEAGTMLRNSMIRVLAPSSEKAEYALRSLGITVSEVREQEEALKEEGFKALSDDDLALMGLNPYNEMGQAKPILQIYAEMGEALAKISGGYENIQQNGRALSILQSVFGNRTITGALNIINTLKESKQLYDELTGGAAEGVGKYVAEGMMDTLYGSEELLKSKVEELERRVGEKLSVPLENAYTFLGNVTDMLSGLDDSTFNSLVSGLTTLAVAGPGMLLASWALRGIGNLLTPGGLIATGAVALASLVSSMNTLKETKWNEAFGTAGLDKNELGQYIVDLGEDFQSAYENVEAFRVSLNGSVDAYSSASEKFSSKLLTYMLKSTTITDEDLATLRGMGTEMYNNVILGISAGTGKSKEFWKMLYGEEAESNPMYQQMMELLDDETFELTAEADRINGYVHDLLMSAFDRNFTEDDYQKMLGYMEQYNALMARASREAENREMLVEQGIMLHKAQTASADEIREMANTAAEKRDADLAKLEHDYLAEMVGLELDGLTEDSKLWKENERRYQEMKAKTASNYDEFLVRLWESQAKASDMGEDYNKLAAYASLYMSGMMEPEAIIEQITREFGVSNYDGGGGFLNFWQQNDRNELGKLMGNMVADFGGEEALADRIQRYQENGQTDMAKRLLNILSMEQLVNGYTNVGRTEKLAYDILNWGGDFDTTFASRTSGEIKAANKNRLEALFGSADEYNLNTARYLVDTLNGEGGIGAFFTEMGESLKSQDFSSLSKYFNGSNRSTELATARMMERLREIYDLDTVYQDMMAQYPGLSENNNYREYLALYGLVKGKQGRNAESYESAAPWSLTDARIRAQQAYERAAARMINDEGLIGGTEEEIKKLEDLKVKLNMAEEAEKEAAAARKKVEDKFKDPISQEIDISFKFGSLFGTGGTGGGEVELNIPHEASGGRETVPSIFAEAGIPEWYIPEEHTDNTGKLLLAAMSASGFDLIELAAMSGARMFAEGGTSGSGGLSWGSLSDSSGSSGSSGSGSGISVQYSPVIHTDNAEGMQRALLEDKKRLEKWFSEFMERRELYESMVTYA